MAGLLSGQGWCFPAIICLSELASIQHESVSSTGRKTHSGASCFWTQQRMKYSSNGKVFQYDKLKHDANKKQKNTSGEV